MQQVIQVNCEIKSKYIGEWQSRIVKIDPSKNLLGVSHNGHHLFKYFSLFDIKMQQIERDILKLRVNSDRTYEIQGQNLCQLTNYIRSFNFLQKLANSSQTLFISLPKKINYHELARTQTQASLKLSDTDSKQRKKSEDVVYPRQKSYLIESDWAINPEDGGLILISEEKKKNQGKILKFILKKFITTGAFMGISFPVFAMKPQSILETYCKSFGAAPLLFEGVQDRIQRIKKFVAFLFSFSRLFSDMDKPFNPTIGETFQAEIAGCKFSAEQTSHHPPQSSLFFEGRGYKITATLELIAQIGINSATGLIEGDIQVQFADKQKIVGRMLAGEMCGFVLGENRFRPNGAAYVYDSANRILCSYQRSEKDIFRGFIGKLHHGPQTKFEKLLKTRQRFNNFQGHQRKQFAEIYSEMSACWTKSVIFDRRVYIDFQDPSYLPFQPTFEGLELLDSDSRYRRDVELRLERKFQQSQAEKQKIEEQQRALRKLRSSSNNKRNKH